MYLTLHKLTVHLSSPDRQLNERWRHLLYGWVSPTLPGDREVDVILDLRLVDSLPPLPSTPPYFTDSHGLPDNVGMLSVYHDRDKCVLLHFLYGALISLSLAEPVPACPAHISGYVTQAALRYGRFEDITFTSLAPAMRRAGYVMVHAFSAVRQGRAITFVGSSGSGKTTAGLSLVLAGWELLANDITLLEQRAEGIFALAMPGGLTIRSKTFELLPDLQAFVGSSPVDRARVSLPQRQFGRVARAVSGRVAALYFPRITVGTHSGLDPVRRAVALAQLLEESLDRWDRDSIPRHLNLLRHLTQQAKTYEIRLGHDVRNVWQFVNAG